MPTRNVIAPTIALLLMLSVVAPPLSADCTPWGENTQRGDAIYPEGWITSYSLIEITPPAEFIYAIIDGAQAVPQFSQIPRQALSARAASTMTPMPGNQLTALPTPTMAVRAARAEIRARCRREDWCARRTGKYLP